MRRSSPLPPESIVRTRVFAVMAACLSFAASQAHAVDLESLVSPGPLFGAHERDARECADCHERFDRSSQKRLCLRCHEPVSDDIALGQGFHGRLEGDRECRICHTDHEGSEAAIIGLDVESFDHAQTDFGLEGEHAVLACNACHPADKRYREAASGCVDCHGESDPHAGRLGEACADCHAPVSWQSLSFDHATTRFALEGKHADSACIACHPGQRFRDTETSCVGCHRLEDAHRGRLGSACADCHSPAGWKQGRFDHARETRFALAGAHAEIACQSCHEAEPKQSKLAMDCASCHAPDDDHRGLRGPRCESCHGETSWKPSSFDHERDGKTPLRGAHADLACGLCHLGEMYEAKTPTECVDCHASVDVHQGTLGRDCASCHAESSFRGRVRFDHGLTDFPLLALHQLASCEDCHMTKRYTEVASECVGCHRGGDVHEGRLGADCGRCHNPNGWQRWLFDHDRDTRFALSGAHVDLRCELCHHQALSGDEMRPQASSSCRSCHLSDSPHEDAYGRDCERCHVDTSWKQVDRRRR